MLRVTILTETQIGDGRSNYIEGQLLMSLYL